MDTKSQSAGNRVYEDFEPEFQWQRDETATTLVVHLPGFKRDQLKVQVSSAPLLKIIGEQQISDNKWRRITKEFSIPSECDTNDISAKFERERLYIKFSLKPSKPQTQEADSLSSKPREEAKPSDEVSEQKKEEGEINEEKKKKRVTTSGVVENIPPPPSPEALTSKNGENLGANRGLIQRAKTRVLDYTISLRPSLESEDFRNTKNWVNMILLFLFAVVLVIYVRQAIKAFLGVISTKF